jgi:hypothetical protein
MLVWSGRNRQAAAKCRKKRLDAIETLEAACAAQVKKNTEIQKKIEALERTKATLKAGSR